MTGIETAGVVLGGVAGGFAIKNVSEDFLKRLLGPSADFIGENLGVTDKGIQNWSKVFKYAKSFLGENLEMEGKVPAKTLRKVLNEGYWTEDEISAMYLGGILASSRNSESDACVEYCDLISSMNTNTLKLHFLLCHKLLKIDGDFVDHNSHQDLYIFCSLSRLMDSFQAMGIESKKDDHLEFLNCLYLLKRLGLVDLSEDEHLPDWPTSKLEIPSYYGEEFHNTDSTNAAKPFCFKLLNPAIRLFYYGLGINDSDDIIEDFSMDDLLCGLGLTEPLVVEFAQVSRRKNMSGFYPPDLKYLNENIIRVFGTENPDVRFIVLNWLYKDIKTLIQQGRTERIHGQIMMDDIDPMFKGSEVYRKFRRQHFETLSAKPRVR